MPLSLTYSRISNFYSTRFSFELNSRTQKTDVIVHIPDTRDRCGAKISGDESLHLRPLGSVYEDLLLENGGTVCATDDNVSAGECFVQLGRPVVLPIARSNLHTKCSKLLYFRLVDRDWPHRRGKALITGTYSVELSVAIVQSSPIPQSWRGQ